MDPTLPGASSRPPPPARAASSTSLEQDGRDSSTTAEGAEWDGLVHTFLESYFEARPDVAVRAGRHEQDGRLPEWSSEGLAAEAARLRAERARVAAVAGERLDASRRLEREYLLARIDHDLFWLESAGWPVRNPHWYADAVDPNVYLVREYAPLEQRALAYLGYARALPRALGQIRDNLAGPLPLTYVDLGRIVFGGLAEYCRRDVPTLLAEVPATLRRELDVANAAAVAALQETDAWFERRRADATSNFAMGADLFREMLLTTERLDVTVEELERAARAELDRNHAALAAACERLAPGRPIPDTVRAVQARKSAGGAIAGARRHLEELRRLVAQKGLVTVPSDAEAEIAESPPHMRWNPAFIDIPGPYEEGLPSIYYISPPDPAWPAEEQSAYVPGEADLLFISAHEVWPGHFLHFLHSHASPSWVGRVFVGYGFSEGWAHYAEELVREAGLREDDDETDVGQSLNALLRAVRFVSAIGIHCGGLTLDESAALFRDRAFQDAVNARQQAARATFDPQYLTYTLGKLVIRRLRDVWSAPRGGRHAWRDFHDRLLALGGPPLGLARAALLADGTDAGRPPSPRPDVTTSAFSL